MAVWLRFERTVHQILGIEEVASVDSRALQKIPARAMEGIRAAFHHHVYNCAAVVAELRREAVVLYLEFLQALDQRLVVDVGVSALALFRCADQCAVQPNLGCRVALPVGREVRSRRIVVRRARPRHLGDARRQERESEVIPVKQRDFVYVLAGNVCA